MSLEGKLTNISNKLREEEAEKKKTAQEKELEPTRSRIKELEDQKNQLDLVKGSLELESDEKTGIGMKEYSKETVDRAESESARLDVLIEKNKEALESMGIENRDQLAENEEFAEESEVLDYKKAESDLEGLETADSALKIKLKELGIITDEENFSYDSAEKASAEKIQSIDAELMQEKLKTPEGKAEASEMLSKDLEGNIARLDFSINNKTGERLLVLDNRSTISVSDEETKFEDWYHAEILPKNMSELTETYGGDVVHDAIRKAYANKVDSAFDKFDADKKNLDKKLEESLNRSSPEKRDEAMLAYQEFKNTVSGFENTLREKAAELKEKGIEFDPDYVQNYGGNYSDYTKLEKFSDQNKFIEKEIAENESYPPKLNYDALAERAKERAEQLKELTENIAALESEEDIDNFTRGGNSGIAKAHGEMLSLKSDRIRRVQYDPRIGSPEQDMAKELLKFKSYEEAMRYFEEKSSSRESTKEAMLDKLMAAGLAQEKRDELREQMKAHDLPGNEHNIDREIKTIEHNKQEALDLMVEIAKLTLALDDEEIVLDGDRVENLSVQRELDANYSDTAKKEAELQELKIKITKEEGNEPMLFGKEKWKDNLTKLYEQGTELTKEIKNLKDVVRPELSKKHYINLPVKEYSPLERLVQSQKGTRGSAGEVFATLNSKLQEVADVEVPESIVTLSNEFKELAEKLS